MTDNDLIADFMGDERQKVDWNYLYSTSWDWLMPVVEKIDRIGPYYVDIRTTGCFIRDIDDGIISSSEMGIKTRLERTYKCVVEFIKWYDEQKSHEK